MSQIDESKVRFLLHANDFIHRRKGEICCSHQGNHTLAGVTVIQLMLGVP